uniref:Uncharacterized protein n=1 Tax=Anguilla anguilla TaxID=7936 RepID=A0A0E9R3B4_ANGAN
MSCWAHFCFSRTTKVQDYLLVKLFGFFF